MDYFLTSLIRRARIVSRRGWLSRQYEVDEQQEIQLKKAVAVAAEKDREGDVR